MPCDIGKDNNVSRVFLTEKRKCCLDEVDLAEEDNLELTSNKVLRRGRCG